MFRWNCWGHELSSNKEADGCNRYTDYIDTLIEGQTPSKPIKEPFQFDTVHSSVVTDWTCVYSLTWPGVESINQAETPSLGGKKYPAHLRANVWESKNNYYLTTVLWSNIGNIKGTGSRFSACSLNYFFPHVSQRSQSVFQSRSIPQSNLKWDGGVLKSQKN